MLISSLCKTTRFHLNLIVRVLDILTYKLLPNDSLISLKNEHFPSCVFDCFKNVGEWLIKITCCLFILLCHLLQTIKQFEKFFLNYLKFTLILDKKCYCILLPELLIVGSNIVHLTSSPVKSYSWSTSSYVKK